MIGLWPGPGEREALVRGVLTALPAGCWWVPGPREWSLAVLRGASVAMSPWAGSRSYKVAPCSPTLRALHAVGLAIGSGRPAVVQLGQAAVADGALAEALNVATLQGAAVVFVVATRDLTGAPVGPQGPSLAALGAAYGVDVIEVDGSDATAVEGAVRAALERGRACLVEARVGRHPTEQESTP